jgi:hypothetical protein
VTVLVQWEGLEFYWRKSPGQVGLPERIRPVLKHNTPGPDGNALCSLGRARGPCHDPGQPKQLNIAFLKLTAGYARYGTLRMDKPAVFRGYFHKDKLLYSGWGKLCI